MKYISLFFILLFNFYITLGQEVTGFILVNASTNSVIQQLNESDTIDLSVTGFNLNIVALTSGNVGGVQFRLNEQNKNLEGAAPFTMTGDNAGDYNIWTPSPGNYIVEAIPYADKSDLTTAGIIKTVSFVVIESGISTGEIIIPEDAGTGNVTIEGELKKWHKITLTFDGPFYNETDNFPNPFLDYRLNVSFANGEKKYIVPGYFAADGNAANSSANAGNKWQVHFCPDETGTWNYTVSFRIGKEVAVNDSVGAGIPLPPIDGTSGSFTITPSDKAGRDFRGKGRLQYVGEHYLRFAENGEYFLKQGADAPENFLAYNEFDGDFKSDGQKDQLVKSWAPHVKDWNEGDPLWAGTKGKGIIGAVNYLASEGMNVFSFLTLNIDGDDRNVFPYISYNERYHMDVSKLDQWEILFSHADSLGMYLHFKTQETENEMLLDNGETGTQRKLYYRELIARYGHHLALNWNLGEENGALGAVNQNTAQRKAMAEYFYNHDPYHHHIVIHNGKAPDDLLGNISKLTGYSLQTDMADFTHVHPKVLEWVNKSEKAGKPWVVACDEPGDANHALMPDNDDPDHDFARKNGLWGCLMAGGAGNEWYFGYQHAESDLTCQDFRSRDLWWDQCRIAIDFFRKYLPYTEMKSADNLASGNDNWCFAKEGEVYLVLLKNGGSTDLEINVPGSFQLRWFNPKNGGELITGTVNSVKGGGKVNLGYPPDNLTADWVVLVLREKTLSEESHRNNGGKIYPNPVSGRLYLSSETYIYSIEIQDIFGRIVYKGSKIMQPEFEIDVSEINSGLYLIIARDKDNRTIISDKFLKEF